MKLGLPIALGIDIGGTGVKLGLVNTAGEVFGFRSFPTKATGATPDIFLTRLQAQIAPLLADKQYPAIGIGVSVHGFVDDARRGPIACESTPVLRGLDIVGWLETTFNLPVVLNNDLIAHTMAEYHFGVGRGVHRFMVMAIGTGLGAGVMIDGQPLRLIGGTTGDTGRVVIQPGGPKCAYGVAGSAEALCGVAAIERLAQEKYGHPLAARVIIDAAHKGDDAIALAIMQEIGENLGLTLANLSVIFFPDKIALTGGTTAAGHILLDACQKKFNETIGNYHHLMDHLLGDVYNDVRIVFGEVGHRGGVLGAVVELFNSNFEK